MKKKILTVAFLIFLLTVFIVIIYGYKNKYEVIDILSADKIVLDFNKNGIADNGETVCINEISSFEKEPQNENKISKEFKLSYTDKIGLWYLGKEYTQKQLLNKKISYKYIRENSSCKTAQIKINDIDYGNLLLNSGFGIKNGKIGNIEKFKQNIEISKKLNLVVLNHHSDKYHTLDCEYGKMAHDKIIIPLKQLPKGTRPCHFCHNIKDKKQKLVAKNQITGTSPALKLFGGDIALYKFDYTKQLKPNANCSTDVCKLIVNEINNAKENIDIAIYGYDDIPAITSALSRANKKGVVIRFVYDEVPNNAKTFYSGNYIIKNLSNQSTSDKTSSEAGKIMHNKFWIFDRQKVITGSMNFSKSGLSGYDVNDVVIINSPEIAKLYESEFEQMLKGKFHNAKLKHNLPNKFILATSEIEVYFSPQDKTSKRIVELINSAKNYIYVPTFLITHKDITEALIKAKKKNIDVRIIIDANSVNTRNTKHKLLRESGVLLKAENYAGKLHSKTMIIDDEYLILGSMNFSNSGENKNDENMLVIKNPNFAKNYKQFFLYLWNIIPDKYLKYSPKAESFDSIGSCNDGVDNNFDGKIDSEDDGCKIRK
ncbi:DUF1669 domain-containing protein [bacterium]|nr:DUF1669 domain-containing protein [bacterium]